MILFTPICVPRDVLDKIYRKNAISLVGETPKPVNRKMAYDHCKYIEDNYAHQLTKQGRENLECMMMFWESSYTSFK